MGGKPWQAMILNAVVAAAFFFSLQRFIMAASMETAIVWAIAGAAGAALLAWHQASR